MEQQTTTQAPVDPAKVYMPVRMHNEWWKMALFLIACFAIAQIIAIKIVAR
jgi:hypothetical protein